jgi:hypothetical protein
MKAFRRICFPALFSLTSVFEDFYDNEKKKNNSMMTDDILLRKKALDCYESTEEGVFSYLLLKRSVA